MHPYRVVSMVFFILITLIFLYSYIFFPNQHPVNCIYKNKTGAECPSCGTSRAFSFLLRGNLKEAFQINKNAVGLFFFFFIQWLWRAWVFMFFGRISFLRTKTTLMTDVALSLIHFLISVLPFYFA
jgi:hypothetical protein